MEKKTKRLKDIITVLIAVETLQYENKNFLTNQKAVSLQTQEYLAEAKGLVLDLHVYLSEKTCCKAGN